MKIFNILLLGVLLYGCVAINHEAIEKSSSIQQGMTESEVIALLGSPGMREFSGQKQALQYCQTELWGPRHKYAVVWLYEGEVFGLTSYTQPSRGSCSNQFMPVNWGNTPDTTIEIRNR